MPSPTINGFFGQYATVLTTNTNIVASATEPVLVIKQSDFAAQQWDALTSGQEMTPEKWIAAIIRKINDYSTANSLDESANVVVSNPVLGLEVRNELLKRRYSYSVDVYQTDTGTTQPDPDLV